MPPDSPGNPSEPSVVLEARAIVKRFGAVTAVDGISLEVRAGRVTAILGPSGSGKSTLLRCLNFLEVPDAGEVYFEGAPVRARDGALDALRSRVGMVFQQFNLFPHLLVWENVSHPGSPGGCPGTGHAPSPGTSFPGLGSPTRRTPTPPSSRGASSSGRRSPGRSPWSPRRSFLTSPPRRSTPS